MTQIISFPFFSFIPISELGEMTAFNGLYNDAATENNAFTIANNFITGTIPSELGRLSLLTGRFHLYSNELCGFIPVEVAALSSLVINRSRSIADDDDGSTFWNVAEGNEDLGLECGE